MNRSSFLAAAVVLALAGAQARAQAPQFRIGPSADIQEKGKDKVSEQAQRVAREAMQTLERGDPAGAKKLFEQVLALAPGNVPTLINLGLIELRQKKFAEAEALLQSAVKSAPKSGLPWLVLGVIQYEQGKLDAAHAALAMAVHLEPKDARAHHYLGVVVGTKGWYLGAEDQMRKAIELAPDYAEAHYNLAVFYLERKPPAIELARRHYHRSVDLGGAPDREIEKKIDPK
jgi:Flp pilus assembly protein TadD